MKINSEIFEIEKTCEYRGEVYRVRDNGYIYRIGRPNKKKRPLDEKWTLGNVDKQRGYLNFSSEVVHRIVATAFHEQPSKSHVVDHIDTNKQNNRAENLRWVTRLENILLNPITLSRIIYKYGSLDKFFANPSKPKDGQLEQNFAWMRAVTKEESDNTRRNLENWAKEGKIPKGGQLGEWVFRKESREPSEPSPNYILSKTPNAAQQRYFLNDKPNEFPCTPQTIEGNPLNSYYENLKEGKIFFRNHNGEYVVVKSGFSKDRQSIHILTRANYIYEKDKNGENNPVPIYKLQKKISVKELRHSYTTVTFEDNLFVHESVRGIHTDREELEKIFSDMTQEN